MNLGRALFLVCLLGILNAIGCATIQDYNPYENAETQEDYAYATLGIYQISLEQIRAIKESPNTPEAVKVALTDAVKYASPFTKTLREALASYLVVKALVDEGVKPADAIIPVYDALRDAVDAATKAVQFVIKTVDQASRGESTT